MEEAKTGDESPHSHTTFVNGFHVSTPHILEKYKVPFYVGTMLLLDYLDDLLLTKSLKCSTAAGPPARGTSETGRDQVGAGGGPQTACGVHELTSSTPGSALRRWRTGGKTWSGPARNHPPWSGWQPEPVRFLPCPWPCRAPSSRSQRPEPPCSRGDCASLVPSDPAPLSAGGGGASPALKFCKNYPDFDRDY
jgi:hypothetical protein